VSVDAGRLVDARLDAASSRAVYRSLLDALARPGAVSPPVPGVAASIPPALLPLLSLADLDVTFSLISWDDDAWTDVVASVTGARPVGDLADADIVAALRPPSPSEIDLLRTGDAFRPELGSRLVIACGALGLVGDDETNRIEQADETIRFTVEGPGASPSRTVIAAGLDAAVIARLAERNAAFPAGVDTWLVAADGSMIGLPRSVRTTVVTSNGGIA